MKPLLQFVMRLILIGSAAACSKVPASPSSVIPEVDRLRSALLKYYELNGHFPVRISDIDPNLEDHRGFDNGGWMYAPRNESYGLVKQVDNFGRDGIWFNFDTEDKEGSGWFLMRENRNRVRLGEFGLSADEERFFEGQAKKGTITIPPK